MSGISSTAIVYSRSAPSSKVVISILGCTAGLSPRSDIARWEESLTVRSSASPVTEGPYFVLSSDTGTLPGRKPGIRTVRTSSWSREPTCLSMSSAGTTILNSRLRPSALVSVTCMQIPIGIFVAVRPSVSPRSAALCISR